MKKILFYKESDQWYADVPGHTKAENRMVAGADKFLDKCDMDHDGKVTIRVGEDNLNGDYIYSLSRIQHDKYGGTYLVKKNGSRLGYSIFWLCNVTHSVLGEHKKKLYIYSIQ